MDKHRRIIGTLFFILGLLICLVVASLLSGNSTINNIETDNTSIFIALTIGLVDITAGYAQLTNLSWAQKATIPAAVLSLLSFPLGTALAVYYFWFYKSFLRAKT